MMLSANQFAWSIVQMGYLVSVIAIGNLLGRAVWREAGRLTLAAVSFPLGMACVTWSLFAGSLIGIPISTYTLASVVTLFIVVLVVIHKSRGEPRSERAGEYQAHTMDRLFIIGLLVLALIAAYFSVGRAVSAYDATAGWALKGYGIAYDGTVKAGADWGMWGLAYPLNNHLIFGTFSLLGGDFGPLSKLAFPTFFASVNLFVYSYWRNRNVRGILRVGGGLFLATNPLLFLHATYGFANLPFVAYLVPGMLLALHGLIDEDIHKAALSGVLLAFASWTRAEGIGYVLFILVMLASTVAIRKWRERWPSLAWSTVPVVFIGVPWLVFAQTAIDKSHLGTAMGGVLPKVLGGQFNLGQLYLIPRLFFDRGLHPENAGYFIPFGVLTAIVALVVLVRERSDYWIGLWSLTLVAVVSPIGLFYVRSFTRIADFEELLIRSFDRAFFPGLIMVVVLGVLAASELANSIAQAADGQVRTSGT